MLTVLQQAAPPPPEPVLERRPTVSIEEGDSEEVSDHA